MAPRTMRRPLSRRERLLSSERALNFCLAAADKPPVSYNIPEKRKRRAPDPADSEAPVIEAVGELLAVHPQVLFAVRQNSGAMHVEGANGRAYPIWMYRLMRVPQELTLPDYWGFMRDGRPLALECKRPSWTKPTDERERKQRAFLNMIEAIGGIGGFVRSADEAKAILG